MTGLIEPGIQQFFGLFGILLLVLAAVVRAASLFTRQRPVLLGLSVVCLVAVILPFGELSFLERVRGFVGDLSITTCVLVLLFLRHRLFGGALVPEDQRVNLYIAVAVASILLYPASLGLFMLDTYSVGYGPSFAWCLWLLAMLAIIMGQHLSAAVLLCSIFAWMPGLLESVNPWDYIMDPLVVAYAIGVCIGQGVAAVRLPRAVADT